MANAFYTAPTSDEITSRYFTPAQPSTAPENPTPEPIEPKPGFFEQLGQNVKEDVLANGGYNLGSYTAPLAKTIVEQVVTPPSKDKTFMQKIGEDAVSLGAAIPIALSHPINTLKSLVTTPENPIGGATVESAKNVFSPDYYKEHPLLGVFNTGTWIATIASLGSSRILGGVIDAGLADVATRAAGEVGAEVASSVVKTSLTKSLLRTATDQALKTGDFSVVNEVAKNALVKGGIEEGAASRIADNLSTSIQAGIDSKATQLGAFRRMAHPIDTIGEVAGKAFSPVAKSVFGEADKSAVARLYGNDVVAKDPTGFAQIEDWASKQAIERGWKDTINNRQSIMNEWASTIGEWTHLTPQEKVAYHQNYITASDIAQKVSDMTGDLVVPTKFLPPKDINAIVETINNAPKNESPLITLDSLEQIYGNDIGIHRASIEKVITANPTQEALVGAIEALGKRHTLSYGRLPEVNRLVQELERTTGYKLIEAPKGKPISFATGVGKVREPANIQIGLTSAQNANPVTAQILKDGEALYQSGKIDEGLAKLQEATNITKDELTQTLSDGITKIQRLETKTHGLYFGTPEASFWLTLKTNSLSETLGSIALFAQKHLQDSFITAQKIAIESMEGSYGFSLKFGKTLENSDVLAIEKIANESGIGLTLNQTTGEAIAYNINQFDGLSPEAFLQAVDKVEQSMSAAGYKAAYSIDKYKLGVYTKDTYGELINGSTAKERGAVGVGAEPASTIGGAIPSAKSAGVGQYTSSLSDATSRLISAKTKLGKLFDKLGLSSQGGVEGTLENLYADEFTQNIVKELGDKYPNGIKMNVINLHTGEVAGVRTIPLDKLYGFLDRSKNMIEGMKPSLIKTRFTVSDISASDLTALGMDSVSSKAIAKVARASLVDLPFAQTGLMEGIVNLARAKVPGFNKFVNLKFETHFNLNPFYAMRFWFKTEILKAMNLREPVVSFGRVLDERLQPLVKSIPYLKDVVAPKIDLSEIKLMADEVLYDLNKNVVDFASNPELITLEKTAGIGRSIQSRNVFLRATGYNIPYDATGFAKAIAAKYGMGLRDALGYSVENGVKTYNNPSVFNEIRNSVQSVFHYEPGILTSPLMKSINTIWFPMRFEAKVMQQTSRWIGSLSPISRLEVMNNWIHTANWMQTPEGVSWRKKYRSTMEGILDWFLPYSSIGETVSSVLQGKLFNGKTGMIGGLPFGFVINSLQDLSVIPGEESTNPITGASISTKRTSKKFLSEASVAIAVEDFLTQILPSMPLYTWLGGTVTPFKNYIQDVTEGALATGESVFTGETPKAASRRIKRQFRNVKQAHTRF